MKTGIIIQARMGSSRLPGKVLEVLEDKEVLHHVIERLRLCKIPDKIIVATTYNENDNILAEYVSKLSDIVLFRGSENDVLARYYYAALNNNLDVVVRNTSDCPLIDPHVTDDIIEYFINNKHDIVSNASADISKRTYPRGLDTEVFSFNMLEKAFLNADKPYQREHVTPYIYENAESIYYYKNEKDYSKYRLTLDTEEDLELIKEIYRSLYKGKHDFYLNDIVKLLEKYPELEIINKHIEQKKIY